MFKNQKMMALGNFVFSMDTAAYDVFERTAGFKWSAHERVGKRSTHQYLGVDDEDISLSGVIFPAFRGQPLSIDKLREMGKKGVAYFLISGTGHILGKFFIVSVREKKEVFFNDGTAQKLEFSLSLKRYDDDKKQKETILDAILSKI